MNKVKIVQIAVALSEEESVYQYLDNKGRVWYDGGHVEKYDIEDNTYKTRWVTEWKLLDMPEEPES